MNLRHFLLFLTLLPFAVHAQLPNEPAFQHLLPERIGIDKMYGTSIDSNGRVWLLTENGLVCYNGYSTKLYAAKPGVKNGLMSNLIQSIFIDSKERLWLAYQDTAGITRFEPDLNRFTHFLPDPTRKDAAPGIRITRFREDSRHRFWVLTWGAGMAQMDPDKGTFTYYQAKELADPKDFVFDKKVLPNNVVKAMTELPDGRFLLGFFDETTSSTYPVYFDAERKTFEPFPLDDYLHDINPQEAERIKYISRILHFIHVDQNQDIWMGTYSGLIFFDTKHHTARRISGRTFQPDELNLDNARNYVVDENQLMWVGTPNKGILLVDMRSKEAMYLQRNSHNPSSLYDNRVQTVSRDPDGNIWITTGTGVISIYSPLVQQFSVLPWDIMDLDYTNQSEQQIPVQQMLVRAKNNIYVSSENGMTVYDGEKRTIKEKFKKAGHLNDKKREQITYRAGNFKPLRNGDLLMITPEEPFVYQPGTKQFVKVDMSNVRYPGGMRILFRHLVYDEKIYLCNHRASDIYEFDQEHNRLKYLMHIGTPFGSDREKRTWVNERFSFVLPDGRWMISAGEKKFLIVNPADTSYLTYGTLPTEHHFPDSTINTAYLDPQNNMWICTENGLYQFDVRTGRSEYLSKKIGLDRQAVKAMITDKKGIRWLALEKHIVRWNPKNNSTFIFRSELGLNAGAFIPSIAQTDEDGQIYMASLNGIIRFDPEKLKLPESKPKLSLSFLSIKEDTLSDEDLEHFAKQKTSLAWNQNFLNMEFSTNQVYTPAPHHFYYRLVGLDSAWQNNGTSNRLRYTNLEHGDYTLEVKIVNIYNIESEVLRIRFSIARPFWTTWWFYATLTAVLFGGIWLLVRLRERAHRKREEELEQGIRERTAEIVAKAEEIRIQKDIIQDKNKELTDSIHYAQKIQQSILPNRNEIAKYLPEHFILFKPKDIVSGDFYWFTHQGNSVLWAVVDCTGHGVPGGFMSMLGAGLLNQIVNEELKLEPNEILNQLRERVIMALKQTGSIGENRDGMDISLCRYIPSEQKLQFSGANNSLYLVRNGELKEIAADKQPIGIHTGEKRLFTLRELLVERGDIFYMASDGYADQFGGEKGKKFKTSNLEKLLVQVSAGDMNGQLEQIEDTFVHWKADYEQLDDVCVIGVKV